MTVPAERPCCACGLVKPLTEFAKHKTGKWGHRSRNPCSENGASAKWRAANREKHRVLALNWYHANKERQAANHRAWVAANRERANERARRRSAALRNAPVERIDAEEVFRRDGWICQLCGKPVNRGEQSIDHIRPLSLGGGHTKDNVQLAHRVCNSSKGNRVA